MKTTGIHVLSEFSGCPAQKLADAAWLAQLFTQAAHTANMGVLSTSFNRLSAGGMSGVMCLADAQISIRTWPDAGYAALDIYACEAAALPRALLEQFIKDFGAKSHHTVELERGIFGASGFGNRVVDAPESPATVATRVPVSATAPDPTTAKTAVRKRHIPQPIDLR